MTQRWCLLVLLPALIGLMLPGTARAAAAQRKMVVGKISGVPMGTWMTVVSGKATPANPPTTTQVDLDHAKVSEKGKALKRYDLREGMQVRVKGVMRGISLAADTVEILARSSPKSSAPAHKK